MKSKIKYLFLMVSMSCVSINVFAECLNDVNCQGHYESQTTTTTNTTTTENTMVSTGNYQNDDRANPTKPDDYDPCFVAPCSPGCAEQNPGCGGQTVTTTTTTTTSIYVPPEQCWRFSCYNTDGSPVSHVYTRTNDAPTYNTAIDNDKLIGGTLPDNIVNEIKKLPKAARNSYNGTAYTERTTIINGIADSCTLNPCASGCKVSQKITEWCNSGSMDVFHSMYDGTTKKNGQVVSSSHTEVYYSLANLTEDQKKQVSEFAKRCYWEKFNLHETGQNCCEPVANCYTFLDDGSGKEFRGDFESYPNASECNKHCYANNTDFKKATFYWYGYDIDLYQDVFWKVVKESGKLYNRLTSDIKNQYLDKMVKFENVSAEDCRVGGTPPPEPPCEPEPGPKTNNETVSAKCEEETIQYNEDDSVRCGTSNTPGFYTIDCKTKFSSSFDYGNNGLNSIQTISLYPGQGFGYKVGVEYVKECTGTFDAQVWNAYYDSLVRYRNKITKGSRDWYKQNQIIEELKKYANDFNNWSSTLNDVPKVELTIYSNPVISIKDFISNVVADGNSDSNKVITSTVTLKDGTKVNNFKYSNAKNPRKIEYYPPVTYFDAITGKEATSTTVNKVNGGNKVYTLLDLKPSNYNFEIKVNDVNNNKQIINNKCSVNVLGEKDKVYRIIDVENPFVNDDFNIGNNWLNSQYDFTNAIESDTWNKKSLYSFDLAKEIMKAIEASTSDDTNKYLGGECEKPENEQDPRMRSICKEMNK